MTDEYTPTTAEIRRGYIGEPAHWMDERVGAEFDRWLRSKLADAWDSAIYHVEPMLSPADRRAAHADNPYREAS